MDGEIEGWRWMDRWMGVFRSRQGDISLQMYKHGGWPHNILRQQILQEGLLQKQKCVTSQNSASTSFVSGFLIGDANPAFLAGGYIDGWRWIGIHVNFRSIVQVAKHAKVQALYRWPNNITSKIAQASHKAFTSSQAFITSFPQAFSS